MTYPCDCILFSAKYQTHEAETSSHFNYPKNSEIRLIEVKTKVRSGFQVSFSHNFFAIFPVVSFEEISHKRHQRVVIIMSMGHVILTIYSCKYKNPAVSTPKFILGEELRQKVSPFNPQRGRGEGRKQRSRDMDQNRGTGRERVKGGSSPWVDGRITRRSSPARS